LKIVRFPVCCPLCRQEVLGSCWIWEIDSALTEQGALSLYAPCHGMSWNASATELEQIREYRWVADFCGRVLPQFGLRA